MNKVHIIKTYNGFQSFSQTFCGLSGCQELVAVDEYSTALGDRFEAVLSERSKEATCFKCVKIIEKRRLTI